MTTPEAALAAALTTTGGNNYRSWDARAIIDRLRAAGWVLTPDAPEVPPPTWTCDWRPDDLNPGPECPYCEGEMCARFDGLNGCTHGRIERHGYATAAATRTPEPPDSGVSASAFTSPAPTTPYQSPEPPDSGDGGIDAALLAEAMARETWEADELSPDEIERRVFRHDGSLWPDDLAEAERVIAIYARLRSDSPAPEGGE